MKYVNEFRQKELAHKIAENIKAEVQPDRDYHIMEFCGGHTHAIFRYGVQDLMPKNVHYVHGPGCPVCVLPIPRIDNAIELCERHNVILCTYGDMMRVPASQKKSLIKAKAAGADVRMVYSTQNALELARQNPERDVVFFAIGFETTTPPTAIALQQARKERLMNFSVFCNHVLTPSAIGHILDSEDPQADAQVALDGFLGPSHVSSVIGTKPYEPAVEKYKKPVVIAGFEPLDVMQASLMLIRQINEGRCEVENEYHRVVTRDGNLKAQQLVAEVFELRDTFEWRGLGWMEKSALQIRAPFAQWDAEKRFELSKSTGRDVKGCACPDILRGMKKPTDCKLFGTICTPEDPQGACMVSSEGSCAAYWSYGRFRMDNKGSENAA
ncbi:hydrogenase formation protein HypD [Terasakiella sp. SH-1]|uniref:hydrogenase formation protein HypD n=1 Tax=Terasakiella sp. SH-1 TaxID=2560057 RepID=UPI00107416E3|nr:hydrogenase formation protein HypD [Terasakiella sp. SH-1]